VSHEFNNALTTMVLSVEILEDGPLDRRQEMFAMLRRHMDFLKATVLNFLNQARMDSGNFTFDFAPTDLCALIHRSVDALAEVAKNKDVDILEDFPPTKVLISLDANAINLVMTNLIGNAVKYSPAGSRVVVRIEPRGSR